MSYVVSGKFSTGKGSMPFEREVAAESENHAEDVVLAQLSSEHSISRANISVESVEEQ